MIIATRVMFAGGQNYCIYELYGDSMSSAEAEGCRRNRAEEVWSYRIWEEYTSAAKV